MTQAAYYEDFWADAPQDPAPWAWERRRAMLLDAVRPGERVLDLGCGAGRFVAALRDAGAEPVGVEIAQAALDRAARNAPGADLRLLEGDGSLPLEHASVDVVWCSEVLEHVPDTAHLLLEARRVLRPGGRLLVTVPFHGRVKGTLLALAALRRALRPARPARALLHAQLARAHAGAVRVRGGGRAPVGWAAAPADGAQGVGAAPVAGACVARVASSTSEIEVGDAGSRL